jgi:hypothetical protein
MKPSVQMPLPVMEVNSVNRDGLTPVNSVNREREWLGLVPRAMEIAGVTRQEYAGYVGVSEQLLSMQLSAVENKHLSFRRMWRTPSALMQELVLLIIDFYHLPIGNLSEQDRRDLEYGRAMREAHERRFAR